MLFCERIEDINISSNQLGLLLLVLLLSLVIVNIMIISIKH